MKTCEEYAALLDAYADGELSSQEAERVRAHAEDCPDCRAYLEDILAIRAAFPEAEDAIVPEGFAERVMARVAVTPQISPAKTGKKRSRRFWGGTAAAAACAVLVLHFASTGGMWDLQTRASGGAPQEAMDSAAYSVTADAAPSGQESAEAGSEGEKVPQLYSAMDSTNNESDSRTKIADGPNSDAGQQYAAPPAAPETPAAVTEAPAVSPAVIPQDPETVDEGSAVFPNARVEDPAVAPTVSAAGSTTPLPDLCARVTIPAEDADLLADYLSTIDEGGRTCWLLEPEEYASLLAALEDRDSQAAAMEEDASPDVSADKEVTPVAVYLAEE